MDERNKRWHREIYHVLELEESILWNGCAAQSNLQIQCNPNQITNGIFHRIRTKYFTLYLKTQDTLNSQNKSWERKTEPQESGFLTSDYDTKLQPSKKDETGTKPEI